MTTDVVTTVVDQTSDAAFRTWVAEFIARLLAVGLTQTADTGQINTATVTRAAINTDAGYAIFRFNDTLQATAPIFIKVLFGSGASTSTPRVRVQIGTASNGSGTVSGLGSANTDVINLNSVPASISTPYGTYTCYNATYGTLWMTWKRFGGGAAGFGFGFFYIGRTTDSTGATTGDGVVQMYSPTTTIYTVRTISYLSNTIYVAANGTVDMILQPYGITATLVGGVAQLFKAYYVTPRMRPMLQVVMSLDSEIPQLTAYTATTVGTTPHTYLAANCTQSTVKSLGILWE